MVVEAVLSFFCFWTTSSSWHELARPTISPVCCSHRFLVYSSCILSPSSSFVWSCAPCPWILPRNFQPVSTTDARTCSTDSHLSSTSFAFQRCRRHERWSRSIAVDRGKMLGNEASRERKKATKVPKCRWGDSRIRSNFEMKTGRSGRFHPHNGNQRWENHGTMVHPQMQALGT